MFLLEKEFLNESELQQFCERTFSPKLHDFLSECTVKNVPTNVGIYFAAKVNDTWSVYDFSSDVKKYEVYTLDDFKLVSDTFVEYYGFETPEDLMKHEPSEADFETDYEDEEVFSFLVEAY